MGSRRYRAQEDTGEDQPTHERVPSRLPKRQRRDALSAAPSLPSITRIKGKLRDVKRTLERSKSLPADVRIEKERELAGYKIDLEQAESEKRKQQMIKKYHMVRFFGQSPFLQLAVFAGLRGEVMQDLLTFLPRAPESYQETQTIEEAAVKD